MKVEFCTTFDGFTLADTMIFDELYEPQLQMYLEDKADIFDSPSIIALYMKVNGQLAGELYGITPNDIGDDGEEVVPQARIHHWNEMYCYSITILPQFRYSQTGIQLSHMFKMLWLDLVKKEGYGHVIGHSTSRSASRINASFGARFFPEHNIPNIFDSPRLGEYYEITL